MNVLVVGSGAREHTIAWRLRDSPKVTDLFATPGNPGTADLGMNLDVPNNHDAIVRACRDNRIEFVVVGSEEPLAAGLIDRLAVEGIAAFGPGREAAAIESSKVFSKELMAAHGIPTAPYAVFDDRVRAHAFVESEGRPLVVKADGLARGKGAIVTSTTLEAREAIDLIMRRREFGAAGDRVVVEQRLFGREVSAHALSDGETVAHLPFSCDHKRVFDHDQGPNTGGMGAYSPPGWLSESMAEQVREHVSEAAVRAMRHEGRPYCGVLYPNVIVTEDGPMVIEFNSRFGDPEAQVLLPRLQSDLFDALWAVANNRLGEIDLRWSDEACVGVVLASSGYPGRYETGLPIEGLEELEPDVFVFHAGTRREGAGTLQTAGGRVLTVSACGPTMEAAREKAYRNAERIHFDGIHYRADIAAEAGAAGSG